MLSGRGFFKWLSRFLRSKEFHKRVNPPDEVVQLFHPAFGRFFVIGEVDSPLVAEDASAVRSQFLDVTVLPLAVCRLGHAEFMRCEFLR